MKPYAVFLPLALLAHPAISAPLTEYTCSFSRVASMQGVKDAGEFSLTFVADTTTGDAFMRANNGIAPVLQMTGEDAVTFLEPLKSGALQSTTILSSGLAVHSRHTVLFAGELTPSQYYGRCTEE